MQLQNEFHPTLFSLVFFLRRTFFPSLLRLISSNQLRWNFSDSLPPKGIQSDAFLGKNRFQSQILYIKINLSKFCFIESLFHTAILKNLNYCANSARSKTWSRKNISWTEMRILLTKPSNVLLFYTSSQNSNLLYSEVDFLKRS